MKKQQRHITSGTGWCVIEIDKRTKYESILARFLEGSRGKHGAIGYAQGYVDAMLWIKRDCFIQHTAAPQIEGWRWWNDTTEWMVVDKNGKMAK